MNFRRFLPCALLPALALGFAAVAQAASYPSYPIRIVVPYSAGGSSDVPMRAIAAQMSKQMNQSIVIENRPGASAMLGSEFVARALPDGYTLILLSNPQASGSALYRHLTFDPVADVAPISFGCRARIGCRARPRCGMRRFSYGG